MCGPKWEQQYHTLEWERDPDLPLRTAIGRRHICPAVCRKAGDFSSGVQDRVGRPGQRNPGTGRGMVENPMIKLID